MEQQLVSEGGLDGLCFMERWEAKLSSSCNTLFNLWIPLSGRQRSVVTNWSPSCQDLCSY